MIKNPIFIDGWTDSFDILAKRVSKLRGDKLQEFLQCLANKLANESIEEAHNGNEEKCYLLQKCSRHLYKASIEIKTIDN